MRSDIYPIINADGTLNEPPGFWEMLLTMPEFWLVVAVYSWAGFVVYNMIRRAVYNHRTVWDRAYVCPDHPDKLLVRGRLIVGDAEAPRHALLRLKRFRPSAIILVQGHAERAIYHGKIDWTYLVPCRLGVPRGVRDRFHISVGGQS